MMLCVALVSCTVAEPHQSARNKQRNENYAQQHWSNVCKAHACFRYSVYGLEGSGHGSIVQPIHIRSAGHHTKEC